MNYKIAVLIVLSSLLLMGSVSAAKNISYFENSTNVTFEGLNFTIPAGFGVSKDPANYDKLGSEGKTCYYADEDNGTIEITVISDWMGMSLDELEANNSKKASINGHQGWRYAENNLHYFGYICKDKGVIVGVTNQSRLSDIIR